MRISVKLGSRRVASWFELISVRPLCSLCLGGESLLAIAHDRDTEDTEVTQRKLKLGHYQPTTAGTTCKARPLESESPHDAVEAFMRAVGFVRVQVT